jgi:hypothetical protein
MPRSGGAFFSACYRGGSREHARSRVGLPKGTTEVTGESGARQKVAPTRAIRWQLPEQRGNGK